ncbi:MAG: hypothetical protein ACTHQQ_20210 [Solirubrobacteraceae bacterium]
MERSGPIPVAWFPFAAIVGVVPWWEPPLIALAIGAVVTYALLGSAPETEKSGSSAPAATEVQDIDRTLTTHAIGIVRLVAVLGAGFVAAVKLGSLSVGLIILTLTGLLLPGALGTAGLALVGGPLLVRGLHEEARADRAAAAIRRVYRRARLIRTATWCFFPMATLTVTSTLIALLGHGK